MTDRPTRVDTDADDTDDHRIDRRQLLRIGAWAAPVIVLATAAPAAASSPDDAPPDFDDLFVWSQINFADNYSAIQAADSLLVSTTGRPILAVVATLAVSPAPGAQSWVPRWDFPSNAEGSWSTVPFDIVAGQSGPTQLKFQVRTSDYSRIPPGTYTVTLLLTWTENGATTTVSTSRAITIG